MSSEYNIYGAPIVARMINTVDIRTSSIGCRSRRRDNYNSGDGNDYRRTTDFRALYLPIPILYYHADTVFRWQTNEEKITIRGF